VTGVSRRGAPHPDCARVVPTSALDSVLPGTEFLVLACPLTAETRGLMDRRRLSLLPKGAGVVNIGRGALLEEDALCDLLDAGHLGGAVLDVFTTEPVPPEHRLWATPKLVMTPHISTDDPGTYNVITLGLLLRNLRALRDGQPLPNAFDTRRGY
jgi:phosphoglycerate dehydrogenase-like enzyme